jgi:hypothetical protein
MKVNTRIVASLFLNCIGFFFVLACLDYLFMSLFNIAGFAANADLLYRYWMILALVVIVAGFGFSFIGYLTGLPNRACIMLFLTYILLFAGGLLDLFYASFTLLTNQSYSFDVWSLQYKLFGFWNWPLQALWSVGFFGSVIVAWWKLLRK